MIYLWIRSLLHYALNSAKHRAAKSEMPVTSMSLKLPEVSLAVHLATAPLRHHTYHNI